MNSYEEFMVNLAPGWLVATYTGRQYQAGRGEALDQLVRLYSEAVQARFIASADAQALYLLGAERGLEVFVDEPLEAYRRRVAGAWEFWKWAGTNTGIMIVLNQLGFTARIYEHYLTEPDKWAEFSIDITPTDAAPTLSKYDDPDTVYDGENTRYDVFMRVTEIDRVRALVDKVKSAQSRLRRLTFTISLAPRYDSAQAVYDDPNTAYEGEHPYTVEL